MVSFNYIKRVWNKSRESEKEPRSDTDIACSVGEATHRTVQRKYFWLMIFTLMFSMVVAYVH